MGDVETLRRVSSLVAEIALDEVVAQSGSTSAVIARRAQWFGMSPVASRSESGWSELLEPVTELRKAFSQIGGYEAQVDLSDSYALISRYGDGPDALAAIVVRPKPFTPDEEVRIQRLLKSVMSVATTHDIDSPLIIVDLVEESNGTHWATVSTDDPMAKSSTAGATHIDPVTATALAATALTQTRLSLRFAAQTSLEDGVVSIVLVETDDGGPLFGVSFDTGSAQTGPAAAVLRAARLSLSGVSGKSAPAGIS